MPFATFGLPFFAPRRWELVGLAVAWVLALALDAALGGSPEVGLLRILGVVPGIVVGATMATRSTGPFATWAGLGCGALVSGLLPRGGFTLEEVTTAALFAALGMGTVAWRRASLELTYARSLDVLCGLATLALVFLALGLSWAGGRLAWPNGAAFLTGCVVGMAAPRTWDPPVSRRRGSLEPGSLLDRIDP